MNKLKKYLIPALVLLVAVFGSINYFSTGHINIESPVVTESVTEESEIIILNSQTEVDNAYETISDTLVDINTASSDELQIAPGIGPSKAQAIIDYRNKYGKFSSVDELIEVSGIGEKTLAKIRDYYTVNH